MGGIRVGSSGADPQVSDSSERRALARLLARRGPAQTEEIVVRPAARILHARRLLDEARAKVSAQQPDGRAPLSLWERVSTPAPWERRAGEALARLLRRE